MLQPWQENDAVTDHGEGSKQEGCEGGSGRRRSSIAGPVVNPGAESGSTTPPADSTPPVSHIVRGRAHSAAPASRHHRRGSAAPMDKSALSVEVAVAEKSKTSRLFSPQKYNNTKIKRRRSRSMSMPDNHPISSTSSRYGPAVDPEDEKRSNSARNRYLMIQAPLQERHKRSATQVRPVGLRSPRGERKTEREEVRLGEVKIRPHRPQRSTPSVLDLFNLHLTLEEQRSSHRSGAASRSSSVSDGAAIASHAPQASKEDLPEYSEESNNGRPSTIAAGGGEQRHNQQHALQDEVDTSTLEKGTSRVSPPRGRKPEVRQDGDQGDSRENVRSSPTTAHPLSQDQEATPAAYRDTADTAATTDDGGYDGAARSPQEGGVGSRVHYGPLPWCRSPAAISGKSLPRPKGGESNGAGSGAQAASPGVRFDIADGGDVLGAGGTISGVSHGSRVGGQLSGYNQSPLSTPHEGNNDDIGLDTTERRSPADGFKDAFMRTVGRGREEGLYGLESSKMSIEVREGRETRTSERKKERRKDKIHKYSECMVVLLKI